MHLLIKKLISCFDDCYQFFRVTKVSFCEITKKTKFKRFRKMKQNVKIR